MVRKFASRLPVLGSVPMHDTLGKSLLLQAFVEQGLVREFGKWKLKEASLDITG